MWSTSRRRSTKFARVIATGVGVAPHPTTNAIQMKRMLYGYLSVTTKSCEKHAGLSASAATIENANSPVFGSNPAAVLSSE